VVAPAEVPGLKADVGADGFVSFAIEESRLQTLSWAVRVGGARHESLITATARVWSEAQHAWGPPCLSNGAERFAGT
jgi:hypothetical protein